MWKLSKSLSSFFNYCLNKLFTSVFSIDYKINPNLLIYLSIKRIYKFSLYIEMCINQVKYQMYNSEKNCIFLSKNTKSQAISLDQIHKTTGFITILRSKNLILYS